MTNETDRKLEYMAKLRELGREVPTKEEFDKLATEAEVLLDRMNRITEGLYVEGFDDEAGDLHSFLRGEWDKTKWLSHMPF